MSENLLPFGFHFNVDNDLIIAVIDERIKERFNYVTEIFRSSNNIGFKFLDGRLHLYNNIGNFIDVDDTITTIHFPRFISEGTHNHFTSKNLSRSQRKSLEIALSEFQQFLLKELNKEVKEDIKPEIGIKPRNIHESLRVQEICEAIIRYKNSDKAVPEEWIEELSDLVI